MSDGLLRAGIELGVKLGLADVARRLVNHGAKRLWPALFEDDIEKVPASTVPDDPEEPDEDDEPEYRAYTLPRRRP